jgi:shikimate kinase
MPGAGKSTVGIVLAKNLSFGFIDTDILIQVRRGQTLQEIVDAGGPIALRILEEAVLLDVDPSGRVVATGGSAVYSARAIMALKIVATVVWLRVPLDQLEQRLDNFESRGIVREPGQTLEQLFAEREALYEHHADIVVDAAGQTPEDVVVEVLQKLSAQPRK